MARAFGRERIYSLLRCRLDYFDMAIILKAGKDRKCRHLRPLFRRLGAETVDPAVIMAVAASLAYHADAHISEDIV